jgi:hypothetical protein
MTRGGFFLPWLRQVYDGVLPANNRAIEKGRERGQSFIFDK